MRTRALRARLRPRSVPRVLSVPRARFARRTPTRSRSALLGRLRTRSALLARLRTRSVLLALGALLLLAAAAFALSGPESHPSTSGAAAAGLDRDPVAAATPTLKAHPHLSEPVAGVEPSDSGAPVDAGPVDAGPVDASSPEAQQADSLPQPISDAEIRRELAASGIPSGDSGQVTAAGLAVAPFDAPDIVKEVVQAGNQIARDPYRFGGGHRTWVDNAYDCSGSISFAFAAAGLLSQPLDSTSFARWGRPGRGRWITVYANAGHAFANIAGVWFDTSGLKRGGSRWQTAGRSGSGYAARHPPGL